MNTNSGPPPWKPQGRRPKSWSTGNPDFERPEGMTDSRWNLCCQILWTIALDGDGQFRDANATALLRYAMKKRGVYVDSQNMANAIRDMVDDPRWNGLLAREKGHRTATTALWLTVTPDQLPPNPFVDEDDFEEPDEEANLPAVIQTTESFKPSGSLGELDEGAAGDGGLTVDFPENHLPDMTSAEELSLAISLIANVITRDAAEIGAAMNAAAMQSMEENMRLREEMARKDAEMIRKDSRIRDLTLTIQRMRAAIESQHTSV